MNSNNVELEAFSIKPIPVVLKKGSTFDLDIQFKVYKEIPIGATIAMNFEVGWLKIPCGKVN